MATAKTSSIPCPYCNKPVPVRKWSRKESFCPFCAGRTHRHFGRLLTDVEYASRNSICFFCCEPIVYPPKNILEPIVCKKCGGITEWPDPEKYPDGFGEIAILCPACRWVRYFDLGHITKEPELATQPRHPMPVHGACPRCKTETDYFYTGNLNRTLPGRGKQTAPKAIAGPTWDELYAMAKR